MEWKYHRGVSGYVANDLRMILGECPRRCLNTAAKTGWRAEEGIRPLEQSVHSASEQRTLPNKLHGMQQGEYGGCELEDHGATVG